MAFSTTGAAIPRSAQDDGLDARAWRCGMAIMSPRPGRAPPRAPRGASLPYPIVVPVPFPRHRASRLLALGAAAAGAGGATVGLSLLLVSQGLGAGPAVVVSAFALLGWVIALSMAVPAWQRRPRSRRRGRRLPGRRGGDGPGHHGAGGRSRGRLGSPVGRAALWTLVGVVGLLLPSSISDRVEFMASGLHVLLFVGFTWLWLRALRRPSVAGVMLVLLLAAALGWAGERAQHALPALGRDASLSDFEADLAGIALGFALWGAARLRRRAAMRRAACQAARRRPRPAGFPAHAREGVGR